MRYYTLKIAIATDGTETRDLRGFDTLDEALVRFHSDLSGNIGKVTSIAEMLLCGDLANGGDLAIKNMDNWTAETATTEA